MHSRVFKLNIIQEITFQFLFDHLKIYIRIVITVLIKSYTNKN
jgi:hypothetical protein